MKTSIAELNKRMSSLQKTVTRQRKELSTIRKAQTRQNFNTSQAMLNSREDAFRPSTAEDYLQLYENHAHIFACVHAIARNCAKLPLRIYHLKKISGDKDRIGDEITDGPWWELINTPNKFMSRFGLIYSITSFLNLTGNAYVERVGGDIPIELWSLRPDWMKIKADPKELIAGYEYTVDSNRILYKPEEILRFKQWHPRSELYGMSPISPGQNSVVTDLYCTKYTKQFFKQGGHINWYIKVKDTLSDESYQRLEQQIKTKVAGLENAHMPWIVDQEGDIKELGSSPDRNTLIPQKTWSREEICEIYGVPVLMLGLPNETHYNNAEAQRTFFWEETIQPQMTEVIHVLNQDIFWPNDMEVVADYSGIAALQPDMSKRATTGNTLFTSGLFTKNEVRTEVFQKDPVEKGDTFYQAPQQFGSFGGFGGQPQQKSLDLPTVIKIVEVMIEKGGQGSGHFGHYPSERGPGSSPAITEEKLKEIEKDFTCGSYLDAFEKLRGHGLSKDEAKRLVQAAYKNGSFRQELEALNIRTKGKIVSKRRQELKKAVIAHRDKLAAANYKPIEKVCVDGYKAIGEAVTGSLGRVEKSIAFVKRDMIEEAIASMDKPTKKMFDDLLHVEEGLLRDTLEAEHLRAKGTEIDEDTLSEIEGKIGDKLNKMVDQSMKYFADTSKERVEGHLTKMLESDATVADMTKEFKDLFEGTEREGDTWARTVARTETLKFTESSRFMALDGMGFEEKIWLHSHSDNPRPEHEAADEEVKKLNEPFSTGLMYPGDPNGDASQLVNCGCSFMEYIKGMEEE